MNEKKKHGYNFLSCVGEMFHVLTRKGQRKKATHEKGVIVISIVTTLNAPAAIRRRSVVTNEDDVHKSLQDQLSVAPARHRDVG